MVRRVLLGTLPFVVLAASALVGCTSEDKSRGGDAGNGDGGPSAGGSAGKSDGGHEPSTGGSKATDGGSTKPSDAGSSTHRDRSHLKDTGTTKPLDYSDPALWLCLPGTDPNECLDDIDATVIAKDGTKTVQKVETAGTEMRIFTARAQHALPRIYRALSGLGHRILRTRVTPVTLDDVFFELTGKALRD